MADLTGKTLPNGYPNLVTIGATTDDNPTTGTLENGKGNNLTSVTFDGAVVVNESGGDNDFRVEGDTEANLIFADASTDRVGIGTNAPELPFQINTSANSFPATSGTTQTGGKIRLKGSGATVLDIGQNASLGRVWVQATSATDLSQTRSLLLNPNGGNVGVKQDNPAKELDVNGEIRASGGILFGTDTASGNTLDDYEEGTWTPLYEPFIGSFTSITMDVLHATYTKIGNIVHLNCLIRTDAIDTTGGSSTVMITGAPFTPNQQSVGIIGSQSGWTTNYPTVCEIDANSRIYLRTGNGSGSGYSSITPSNMTNAADSNRVGISITYQTS